MFGRVRALVCGRCCRRVCVRFFKYRSNPTRGGFAFVGRSVLVRVGYLPCLCVVPRALECLAYFVHNRSFVLDWLTIIVGDRNI